MASLMDFGAVALNSAAQAWPSAMYLLSLMFRVLAVASLAPVFVFFLIELAGYTVILATGAHYRQRQFVAMVADSTEAISANIASATGTGTGAKNDEPDATSLGKVAGATSTGAAPPVNLDTLRSRAAK